MPLSFEGYQTRTRRFQQETEAPLGDVLGATAEQAFSELPIPSALRVSSLVRANRSADRLDATAARRRVKDSGLEGRLTIGDDGIPAEALDILIDRKRDEVRRQEVLARAPSGVGAATARLGTAFAASLLDPINVGMAFVPVVGEARYLRYLAAARGVFGRTAVRAGVGAVEGATGAAIIEPLVLAAKTQEQADYGFQDSLLNVAFGTVFGGGLHAVTGGLGDAVSALRPTERETMLRTAVSQAIQGRDVDIGPVTPRSLDSSIPRAQQLTALERDVEQRFAESIERNVDEAVARYANLPDAEGGRVLNTDTARELSPDYVADRTRSAAVHEPASWLVKEMYARLLKEAPTAGRRAVVLFTGGGTGAGKSSGLRLLSKLKDEAQIIYDTNLNGLRSAQAKIDQALDAGKDVQILYTYREPVDALVSGALPRAMRMGRTVPIKEHARTHADSARTIKEIAHRYAGNDRVEIHVIDNSHGKGGARLSVIESIPELSYNRVLDELNAALQAERQAGRISEAVYRGTAGIQGRSRAEGLGQDTGAAGRRQPEQERAAREVAQRQASVESDVTANVKAAQAADEFLAEQPTTGDPIEQIEAQITDSLAELKDVARVAGIELDKEGLAELDELVAKAENYGKAARAAALCGLGH